MDNKLKTTLLTMIFVMSAYTFTHFISDKMGKAAAPSPVEGGKTTP